MSTSVRTLLLVVLVYVACDLSYRICAIQLTSRGTGCCWCENHLKLQSCRRYYTCKVVVCEVPCKAKLSRHPICAGQVLETHVDLQGIVVIPLILIPESHHICACVCRPIGLTPQVTCHPQDQTSTLCHKQIHGILFWNDIDRTTLWQQRRTALITDNTQGWFAECVKNHDAEIICWLARNHVPYHSRNGLFIWQDVSAKHGWFVCSL